MRRMTLLVTIMFLLVFSFVSFAEELDKSASLPSIALKHDDGISDIPTSVWGDQADTEIAVMFDNEDGPIIVKSLSYYVPKISNFATKFEIVIYDASGPKGAPGKRLNNRPFFANATKGDEWVNVDIHEEKLSITGPFFVSMKWLVAPGNNGKNAQFVGTSTAKPAGKSWVNRGRSQWTPISRFGSAGDRNVMIRAEVANINKPTALTAKAVPLHQENKKSDEDMLPVFGNGSTIVRLYGDYFCNPCRYGDDFYELLTELIKKDVITITFIDTPYSPASRFYVKYLLYALHDQYSWEVALQAKRTLHDAAIMRVIEKEDKLQDYLKEQKINFSRFDVTAILNKYSRYLREDGVKSVPACTIIKGSEKKFITGSVDVRKALNSLLEESRRK